MELYGIQTFAMRPNGTGLLRLTDARGFTTHGIGRVRVVLGYSGASLGRQR
jgi:hypothetical protein